jgi:hypothetical protein
VVVCRFLRNCQDFVPTRPAVLKQINANILAEATKEPVKDAELLAVLKVNRERERERKVASSSMFII